jgi:uncharacterized repeat protein (TIGR01451 family)
MRRRLALASVAVVACAIVAPANAQVIDRPGGDVQWEPRATPALSVQGAKVAQAASADAVYSNLQTFRNQSFAAGGATQQFLNTITRLAADDLNLVGTPPYQINGFRFTVTNQNAVDVSARMLVRFYLPDGPGGGPGTLVAAPTYNPIVFTAGRVGTIKTSTKFVLPSSRIWAGVAFDNASGTTGATAAQLDNLAQGIFSPPDLGTSTDQYFVTTAAGSFASDNPAGTLSNFGGAPPADFGWEILTAQDVDLSITKSDGVATASPGGSVVYTITASNAGPDNVFDARVADTFPASLTCSWTCSGTTGNTCAASGVGNINDATVALAAGGSVTYMATCTVSPAATGSLVNTAAIFAPGTAVEANIADNTATDTDALAPIGPPTITKAFGTQAILVNGTTTLMFTLSNPNVGIALNGVGFTDTLPAGLAVATPNGLTSTCGGTVTAVAGGGSVGLTNGGLGAGGSCAITVSVTGLASGLKANTTGAITSTEGGTGGTAQAFLVVVAPPTVAPPTIAKAFGAASIVVNGTTTLTFTLANPNPGPALTGVSFTDTLPAGLVVATPNGLANTCGGTVAAVAGSGGVALANGGLSAGGSCTITVGVTGTTASAKNNTTGAVTSTEGGPGGTASASLTVVAPPTITKAFRRQAIFVNGTTALTFTLANPNAGVALSGVGFTDILPAGLVVATPNGLVSTCGGTVAAVAGSGSVGLVNGGLVAGGSCTIAVNVTGLAAGLKNNVTGVVTSTEGGTGGTAEAFLGVVTPPVVAPPTIAKAFGAASVVLNGTTTLTFTLNNPNPNPGPALSGVGFTDTLPAGLVVAAPNGLASTCGGTATAAAGTGSVALVNGGLAAGGSCTITVGVTGTTAGAKNNVTGAVTSTEGGAGGTASASLAVIGPPAITKAFGTQAILVNGTTTLTFTLTNPNAGTALSGVGFTDALPAGLVVAAPNGLTSTCGGTVTAVAGAGSIGLVNGGVAAGGSCTITVSVTGLAGGLKPNTTSAVTSAEGGTGGTAQAFLVVVAPPAAAPPTIAKAFGAASIPVNGTTTLTFTLSNPNPNPTTLTGVGFTDTLPAGLTVASGSSATCGGTLTTSGGNTIGLGGATIAPNGTCTFSVTVTGTNAGVKNNTTGPVSSTEGGAGGTASASLAVDGPPTIAKAFGAASVVLNGTTTLTFTLSNPNPSPGPALTGVGFADTLPAGLVVATPNGLTGACGGGTITAASGAAAIDLTGATLAAGSSCVFAVNVLAVATGVQANTTGAVTSVNGGAGNTATASTTVLAAQPAAQIPTLSPFALALLALGVLLIGLRHTAK